MKFSYLILFIGFSALANPQCWVNRQYRTDDSNSGQVTISETLSAKLAAPDRDGEQTHSELAVKTEDGASESYLVYIWNSRGELTSEVSFERDGARQSFGLALPVGSSKAEAFKYFSKDLNSRGTYSATTTIRLICTH